jgi:DNA-directed RNA polymerase specialized sigma24 family protein
VTEGSSDEAPLVARAVAGDREALGTLLDRHAAQARGMMGQILGPRAELDDLLGEARLRAVRGIAAFESRSAFATWFSQIAIHVALSEIRRRRRADARPLPLPGSPGEDASRTWSTARRSRRPRSPSGSRSPPRPSGPVSSTPAAGSGRPSMTSCPSEEELVLLAEEALEPAAADAAVAHLAECEACRLLLGRSEAALRYALGGMADAEAAVPAGRSAPTRPRAWPRVAAAAAVLVGFAVGGVLVARSQRNAVPEVVTTPESRLDALLATAERLAAPSPADADESDVALAAFAAADARLALGMTTAEARLADVVERFPGTVAAREARARLAAVGGPR